MTEPGTAVRVGTTLPQFRPEAEPAVAAARAAEAAGLDGVFVFDHLWPIGRPDGDVLYSFTLLGALAAETETLRLGSLVARVGVLPHAVLANTLRSVHDVSGGRLIAGLGTGDRLSRQENEAFGVPYPPSDDRLGDLVACVGRAKEAGIETWVGGRSAEVRTIARDHADALNAWRASPEELAAEGADVAPVPITWAGQVLIGRDEREAAAKLERYGMRTGLVHGTTEEVVQHFRALADAGATWLVAAPLDIGDDPEVMATLAAARTALTTS